MFFQVNGPSNPVDKTQIQPEELSVATDYDTTLQWKSTLFNSHVGVNKLTQQQSKYRRKAYV